MFYLLFSIEKIIIPASFISRLQGDYKGGTPLAYWGIFSGSETER